MNVIHVAALAKSVALLPPFPKGHLSGSAGNFFVGEFFDLPRLASAIGTPVIEWRDLKNSSSTELEEVGCWSAWDMLGNRNEPTKPSAPHGDPIVDVLGLGADILILE
jgi:hypothetical protein